MLVVGVGIRHDSTRGDHFTPPMVPSMAPSNNSIISLSLQLIIKACMTSIIAMIPKAWHIWPGHILLDVHFNGDLEKKPTHAQGTTPNPLPFFPVYLFLKPQNTHQEKSKPIGETTVLWWTDSLDAYIYIYHRWTGPFYHTNNLMPGLATWKTQKNIGPFKIMHPNFSWRSKRLGSLCLLEGVKRRGSLWSNLVLIWRYLPDVCPSQLPHHANTYLKRGFNFFSFWVFLPNC